MFDIILAALAVLGRTISAETYLAFTTTGAVTYAFAGPCTVSHAPNGSVRTVDRVIHTVTVYAGANGLYAKGHKHVESDLGAHGPCYGGWNDGNPAAVQGWLAAIITELDTDIAANAVAA